MKKIISWKNIAILLLLSGVLLAAWTLVLGKYLTKVVAIPDVDKAKELHPFMTGLVMPLLTLGSTLLVFENLRVNTIQNFSNNFFKLIDQHHKLIDNINTWVDPISCNTSPCKGRAFFDELAERIANDYYKLSTPKFNATYSVDKDLCIIAKNKKGKELLLCVYDFHFQIHQSDLSHYFRNLYHIIRYVELSSINQKIKMQHVHILRAQLSNYEILLLAYNGLHPYGEKFHPLINKYELIKGLNTEETLPSGRVKRIADVAILKEGYSHF